MTLFDKNIDEFLVNLITDKQKKSLHLNLHNFSNTLSKKTKLVLKTDNLSDSTHLCITTVLFLASPIFFCSRMALNPPF